MSRSYKKHLCSGISHKNEKVNANRRFRKINKHILRNILEDKDESFKKMQEVESRWNFPGWYCGYYGPYVFDPETKDYVLLREAIKSHNYKTYKWFRNK